MNFNRILGWLSVIIVPYLCFMVWRDFFPINPILSLWVWAVAYCFWINQIGVAIGGTWKLVDEE